MSKSSASDKIIPQASPYEYENRVIAFVDILGFKNIIKDSELNKKKVGAIISALEFLKSSENPEAWNLDFIEPEEDAQKRGIKNFDVSNSICCTCFSDTIVVSAVATDENINYVTSTIVVNLSYLCTYLLYSGILLRGSLTIGSLIHQKTGLIMGPALINAYELEVNTAKYPRIVLSNKLLQKLNYPLKSKKDRFPYHQYLHRFMDGCVGFHPIKFLEVMQSWVGLTEKDLIEYLNGIRSVIINGLNSSFEHPEIYAKYDWLKNEYNELIILLPGIKELIPPLPPEHNIHFSSSIN